MAAKQGVTVIWESWEGMCHCFGMVLWGSPVFKHFFDDWSRFCKAVCGVDEGSAQADASDQKDHTSKAMPLETKGTFFEIKTGKPRDVDVQTLAILGEMEALNRMGEAMERLSKTPEDAKNILPKL